MNGKDQLKLILLIVVGICALYIWWSALNEMVLLKGEVKELSEINSSTNFQYDITYQDSLPPNYQIVTNGEKFRVAVHGIRSMLDHDTKKEAIEYAWDYYCWSKNEQSQKWKVVE